MHKKQVYKDKKCIYRFLRGQGLKKIINLSQKIYNNMPVHPLDDKVVVEQNHTVKQDEYSNTQISLGMHSGTHIDFPAHLIENAKRTDSYELDYFIGEACLIDAFGEKVVTLKAEYKDKIKKYDIVLIYTGYGEYFEKEEYYGEDAPVLSLEFAEYLALNHVKMVGIDLASPDKYPYEIHKVLLSHDVLIIENLNNLEKLKGIESFAFCAMPLCIDAEASITRAIAII